MESKRKMREEYRKERNGYYHFCTDGLKGGLLFNHEAEYAFGMLLMGIISIKFALKIYAFELMPNHIHIILSGTGANCVSAFDYLKRKLSARLVRDGYPPLPEDYWFKLVKIGTEEQMRQEIAYLLRNPPEKGLGTSACYPWGTGWLYHSGIPAFLEGKPVKEMSKRCVEKLVSGEEMLPSEWRIHPRLGLLPDSFVDTTLVHRLFPTPKDLQTALVKDYEAYFQTATRLGELAEFNKKEVDDIVGQVLQKRFDGKPLNSLTEGDKGKLAIILHRYYGLSPLQISTSILVRLKTIQQWFHSKELK